MNKKLEKVLRFVRIRSINPFPNTLGLSISQTNPSILFERCDKRLDFKENYELSIILYLLSLQRD